MLQAHIALCSISWEFNWKLRGVQLRCQDDRATCISAFQASKLNLGMCHCTRLQRTSEMRLGPAIMLSIRGTSVGESWRKKGVADDDDEEGEKDVSFIPGSGVLPMDFLTSSSVFLFFRQCTLQDFTELPGRTAEARTSPCRSSQLLCLNCVRHHEQPNLSNKSNDVFERCRNGQVMPSTGCPACSFPICANFNG